MEVLTANTAQYENLEGFSNGNSHIKFIKDADDNNIIGKEVLNDYKFFEIRDSLKELQVISYNSKEEEI
jgi:hypothetical protein